MHAQALTELWQQVAGPVALSDASCELTYRSGQPLAAGDAGLAGSREGFQLNQEIGRGGMGVVYRARQRSLDRDVALKTLIGGDFVASRRQPQFVAEALVNARLEHPNILPVHELGSLPGGELFLAMKLVEGRSWQDCLQQAGAEQLDEQLEIFLQVCHAVAFAHSRGILHCDLKPANVMLGPFGEVVVVDWGLAVLFGDAERGDGRLPIRRASEMQMPFGTPSYIAPELAEGRGSDLGPWTDVYLLGGVLYTILAGKAPHAGSTLIEAILRAVRGAIPRLPAAAPARLQEICLRALDSSPARRFQSVSALQVAVRDYRQHAESLAICALAEQDLRAVGQGATPAHGIYLGFAQALAGFEHARKLWEGNPAAHAGEWRARCAFAAAAIERGDLGLAEAQTTALRQVAPAAGKSAELSQLQRRVSGARRRRERESRARRALWGGLLAVLLGSALLFTGQWMSARTELANRRARLQQAVDEREDSLLPADSLALQLESARASLDALQLRAGQPRSLHERARFGVLIGELLAAADGREGLLSLAATPLDGRVFDLLGAERRTAAEQAVADCRQRAFELALHNESWDLAGRVLAELDVSEPRREALQDALRSARSAQVDSWVAAVDAALADLLAGRDRPERPSWSPTPEDYVVQLSAYGDALVVARLAGALAGFGERIRAAAGPVAWSQGEREALTVLLKVLGYLPLPRLCVAPLATFLEVVEDPQLAVACGQALCQTGQAEVDEILLRFSRRVGHDSAAWHQVVRFLGKIPQSTSAVETPLAALQAARLAMWKGQPARAESLCIRGLRHAAQEPDLLNLLGLARRDQGKLETALRALDQVVAAAPDFATGHSNRGIVNSDLGNEDAALADFSRAIELDPHSASALSNRGVILLARGDQAAAWRDFSAAIELHSDEPTYYLNRARISHEREEWDAVVADLTRAIWLDRGNADALAERGETYYSMGEYARSLADLEEAIWLHPQEARFYHIRAWALFRLGRADEAVADLNICLQDQPDDLQLRLDRALMRMEAGQLGEALGDFEPVIAADSQRALARMLRGKLLYLLARPVEALADLDLAIEADTCNWEAWYHRGLVHVELDHTQAAVDDFSRSLELNPDHADSYVYRGQAVWALGNLEAALVDSLRAIEVDPGSGRARYLHALLLSSAGDKDQALAELDKTLELTPDYAPAHVRRGFLLLARGQREQAQASFERGRACDPESSDAWHGCGVSLWRMGKPQAALLDFNRALELEPGKLQSLQCRAQIQSELGNFEAALADFEATLERGARPAWAWHNIGWLHGLRGDAEAARAAFLQAGQAGDEVYAGIRAVCFGADPQLLTSVAARRDWSGSLARFLQGKLTRDELLQLADSGEPAGRLGRLCEAHTYLGIVCEQAGEHEQAREHYQAALATGKSGYEEAFWARMRLAEED